MMASKNLTRWECDRCGATVETGINQVDYPSPLPEGWVKLEINRVVTTVNPDMRSGEDTHNERCMPELEICFKCFVTIRTTVDAGEQSIEWNDTA